MKEKFISKKIKWVIVGCCLVFIICLILYFSGILSKFNNEKTSSLISFVAQNAHTGLIEPVSQLAFNDQNKTGNQFASNSQDKIQDKQSEGKQTVATNDIPTALFDVISEPIFGASQSKIPLIIFSAVAGILFILFVTPAARRIKKRNAENKKI